MNLCIDQGNSSSKAGVFDADQLIEQYQFEKTDRSEIKPIFEKYKIDNCILSSVVQRDDKIIDFIKTNTNYFIELSHNTPIPVKNKYKTPETLGKDRLAAVIGASFLRPDSDILIIDAGTAITYDFIDAQNIYHGGNIAPGINLRLRSLHEFTKKLPLVEPEIESPLLGFDTKSAIVSGTLHGIVFEIDGYIDSLKIKYPKLSTFLTGGSTFYFDAKLKNPIFAERNLVLIGLNRILQYNVQK